MPKPAAKSAYTYFVEDFIKEKGAKGTKITYKEGFQEASSAWAKLPDMEKLHYKKMAKGKGNEEKFNTHGISMNFIKNRQAELDAYEARELLEIDEVVENGVKSKTLFDEKFFVIDTNYYCILNDGSYLTCEVAVVSFTMNDGIGKEEYHRLINVGSIPTGYSREALVNSRENGTPMPPIESGEDDMLKIYVQLLVFMDPQKRPLYTFPKKTKQVHSFLSQLCDIAGPDVPVTFRLYTLPKLFHKLRNLYPTANDAGYPTASIASIQLEKDPYMYTKQLACEVHEEGEQYYKCALSVVKRWCYVICDNCCKPAGLPIKKGRHVPITAYTGEDMFEEVKPRSKPQGPGPSVREFKEKEEKPRAQDEPGSSRPYITPAWERPQVVEHGWPTPGTAEDSSVPQEQWPSLGDARKRPGRGGRR